MCHTPLAGTCIWQAGLAWSGGWEGEDPPEGQESPLMLTGLVTGPGLGGWGRMTCRLGPLPSSGLWLWREVGVGETRQLLLWQSLVPEFPQVH